MNKLKSVLLTFALLFISASPALASGPIEVGIVDLPSIVNWTNFTVSYSAAAPAGVQQVTLEYHREGQSWQTLQTYTTTSGQFAINSNHTTQDTKYYFRVTACDNASNCATDETSTTIDRVAPPKPEGFGKNRTSATNYHLLWHNADSDDVYQVYVYRSATPGFTADSSTQVGTVNVSKNTDTNWDNSVPADGKDYYYLVRGVDRAGNASDVVGDIQVITTTTSTTQTTSGPNGTPVSGSEALSGQQLILKTGSVLGEQSPTTSPTGEAAEPTISTSPEAAGVQTEASSPTKDNSIVWPLLGFAGLGLFLYFFLFKKK